MFLFQNIFPGYFSIIFRGGGGGVPKCSFCQFFFFINFFFCIFCVFDNYFFAFFCLFFWVFGHDQAGGGQYASCGHAGGLSCYLFLKLDVSACLKKSGNT